MRSVAEIFQSYEVVDADGRHINGTDKHGANHRYGDAYEKIIEQNFRGNYGTPGREKVKLMMEIGVADGSSLLAWREIFPNALCVGMGFRPQAELPQLLGCAMVTDPASGS